MNGSYFSGSFGEQVLLTIHIVEVAFESFDLRLDVLEPKMVGLLNGGTCL